MLNINNTKFFWLHIKKCGGQTIRNSIPIYKQTNRSKGLPFIALPADEWNDNLNNYRISLGLYDYKRMTFAKKYLFETEDDFNKIYKFVVVRNPYDRAVSIWKYVTKTYSISRPKSFIRKYRFEYFLESLPELWNCKYDRHAATHSAPYFSDITDENGNLLVDDIFRLEEIDTFFPVLCNKLNIPMSLRTVNQNSKRNGIYQSYYTLKTTDLVYNLYKDDIEIMKYKF